MTGSCEKKMGCELLLEDQMLVSHFFSSSEPIIPLPAWHNFLRTWYKVDCAHAIFRTLERVAVAAGSESFSSPAELFSKKRSAEQREIAGGGWDPQWKSRVYPFFPPFSLKSWLFPGLYNSIASTLTPPCSPPALHPSLFVHCPALPVALPSVLPHGWLALKPEICTYKSLLQCTCALIA